MIWIGTKLDLRIGHVWLSCELRPASTIPCRKKWDGREGPKRAGAALETAVLLL